MEEQQPERIQIPLDGSFGAGIMSEITIVTKTDDGRQREETYSIPYWCLDMKKIQLMNDINLILGFKIVKSPEGDTYRRNQGLKELGL